MVMKVDVLDHFAAFDSVKRNWNSVYAADPDANLFLSWDWMSKWLQEDMGNWLILAAKLGSGKSDYVAFFPLRLKARASKSGGFYTELLMAGGNFADYTGAIFRPEHADAAIEAFARHIKSMHWGLVRFGRLRMSEERHARLVRQFPPAKFEILLNYPMIDSSGVDNSICPYVPLPGSWESYLCRLSANTRQQLRRQLRKVDQDPELRITRTNRDNLQGSIEILVEFWTHRWAERKGKELGNMREVLRVMLRHYFDLGILYMPVLWQGERPIGVHASLIDAEKRAMHFFVGARDDNFANPKPGLILHANSIRYAIESGLTTYDFMRGNESYKYSFGAIERRIHNTIIRAKPGTRSDRIFDVRSIPHALSFIGRQRAEGKLTEVEIGYRQILGLEPECLPAIVGYAELMAARGEHEASEKLLRRLIAKQGGSDTVWLALGQCLALQRRWPEAEACCRRSLELNPRLASAHYHIGMINEARGDLAKARINFRDALEIDPNHREARRRLVDDALKPAIRESRRKTRFGEGAT